MYKMVKYPMEFNTEIPQFEFLVKTLHSHSMDYYLFNDFDDALDRLKILSIEDGIALLFEWRIVRGEIRAVQTVVAWDGEIQPYDDYARPDLHIEFYINAGEWLNPDIYLQQEEDY